MLSTDSTFALTYTLNGQTATITGSWPELEVVMRVLIRNGATVSFEEVEA